MRKLNILDFDIECLPGHWIGGDYVSKIITAVAWSWYGKKQVEVKTHYEFESVDLAYALADAISEADIVTGHYIRGFDLPLLNGELMRGGLEPLGVVLTHDTKLDLRKTHGRSNSQKDLGALLGLEHPKVEVTLAEWEGFNTRTPGYETAGVERVRGDVIQHKELRTALVANGWLDRPRAWHGRPSNSVRYHA